MFADKARSLPKSGVPERQERLARDKHSSLLGIFINYGRKSFIILGPGEYF
jgi:hypothetical protein